jgi:hypothetical protein
MLKGDFLAVIHPETYYLPGNFTERDWKVLEETGLEILRQKLLGRVAYNAASRKKQSPDIISIFRKGEPGSRVAVRIVTPDEGRKAKFVQKLTALDGVAEESLKIVYKTGLHSFSMFNFIRNNGNLT